MDEVRYRSSRDDRTLRYAGRVLDRSRSIVLTADPAYLERYDGQVALMTGANLIGRMTPSVVLGFGNVALHPSIPWPQASLHDAILEDLHAADRFGRFCVRPPRDGDVGVHFGRTGQGLVAHGAGWNAYLGPGPSPIPEHPDGNPAGAALAAVLVAAQLFVHRLEPPLKPTLIDALRWQPTLSAETVEIPSADLGRLLFVGLGSVGTAALYFLILGRRKFSASLIDMDHVKVENLDRSPIFLDQDVGRLKVEAANAFLAARGIENVAIDPRPLHESELWMGRSAGTPDAVISAANEMNVRHHIESQYPPIQIYGTTGRNWQASLIRHIPMVEACSSCLFPEETPPSMMVCGGAPGSAIDERGEAVDASLPFLSFAAGLMAAVEFLKLDLPGYPFTASRMSLASRPFPRPVAARIPRRPTCACRGRSSGIHGRMISGTRYASLSGVR